jgi:hypothetical protein
MAVAGQLYFFVCFTIGQVTVLYISVFTVLDSEPGSSVSIVSDCRTALALALAFLAITPLPLSTCMVSIGTALLLFYRFRQQTGKDYELHGNNHFPNVFCS